MRKGQAISATVQDGTCSKGCGRPRAPRDRYCVECRRAYNKAAKTAQKRKKYDSMSERQRLERGVKILDRKLKEMGAQI